MSACVFPTGPLFAQFRTSTTPLLQCKKTAALSVAVHSPVHVGNLHFMMPLVTLHLGVPTVARRRPILQQLRVNCGSRPPVPAVARRQVISVVSLRRAVPAAHRNRSQEFTTTQFMQYLSVTQFLQLTVNTSQCSRPYISFSTCQ
jgi:hypothetical protein